MDNDEREREKISAFTPVVALTNGSEGRNGG
jgi:hypothetical protein